MLVCSIKASESRDSPYFEPLTALSSDDTANEIRKLPVKIQLDGEAGVSWFDLTKNTSQLAGNYLIVDQDILNSKKKGRINCEVERRTATQIIASEPKMVSLIVAISFLIINEKWLPHLKSD